VLQSDKLSPLQTHLTNVQFKSHLSRFRSMLKIQPFLFSADGCHMAHRCLRVSNTSTAPFPDAHSRKTCPNLLSYFRFQSMRSAICLSGAFTICACSCELAAACLPPMLTEGCTAALSPSLGCAAKASIQPGMLTCTQKKSHDQHVDLH
jgi:hypothetical protein